MLGICKVDIGMRVSDEFANHGWGGMNGWGDA